MFGFLRVLGIVVACIGFVVYVSLLILGFPCDPASACSEAALNGAICGFAAMVLGGSMALACGPQTDN